MQRSRAWENYRKTFRKTSCTLAFSWSGKTINKHHVFIAFTVDNSVGKRLENAAFARSGKLWKNVQETSCTLAFSWSRKTIEKHHVFMEFTVSSSVWKMLGKCSVCAWENYGKTSRKTSYTLAYSWSRKTIDKYHVFMTLTVSNSVGKHVENEAFAHTGKLRKNFQENRQFIGIFLVQGNM